MLTLHTETTIDSCHFLRNYKGKCSKQHGHTWLLEVWIMGDSSRCDDIGILFDFGKVNIIKDKLDHDILNNIEPFTEINPTAENLSIWIYNQFKELDPDLMFRVKLFETAVTKQTWCECGDF
jgi:6-pyruvoyltetrahydropterin/6-carboxytetrahydropterin synthase